MKTLQPERYYETRRPLHDSLREDYLYDRLRDHQRLDYLWYLLQSEIPRIVAQR